LGQAENGFRFGGALDDMRVWSVPRSAQDISDNMSTELAGSEPGLAGYWKLNESGGTTVADSSPYHTTGTVGGTIAPIRRIGLTMAGGTLDGVTLNGDL